MKGKYFTWFGLVTFFVGLVLLTTWVSLYDEEHDVVMDGKLGKHNTKSRNLLASSIVVTMIGYGLCFTGYAISTDFLNFSIKMPKRSLS